MATFNNPIQKKYESVKIMSFRVYLIRFETAVSEVMFTCETNDRSGCEICEYLHKRVIKLLQHGFKDFL